MGHHRIMKYFRSTPSVYASICEQLDAAYNYPNAATKTQRTLPLVADLPADSQGRVYLSVLAKYCIATLPSQMLLDLLASQAVDEITAMQYEALLPQV